MNADDLCGSCGMLLDPDLRCTHCGAQHGEKWPVVPVRPDEVALLTGPRCPNCGHLGALHGDTGDWGYCNVDGCACLPNHPRAAEKWRGFPHAEINAKRGLLRVVTTIVSEHIDRAEKRRMAHIWRALWSSVLVGDPAPDVRKRYERMSEPRPGDLVVEVSTLGSLAMRDTELSDDRWDGQFVRYLRTDREWVEWPDGGGYWETYQVCANPDGTEFRWTNADLRAVPDGAW